MVLVSLKNQLRNRWKFKLSCLWFSSYFQTRNGTVWCYQILLWSNSYILLGKSWAMPCIRYGFLHFFFVNTSFLMFDILYNVNKIYFVPCSMMRLVVLLQDWRRKETRQGHYWHRLKDKYPCQSMHQMQWMLLLSVMGKEVLDFWTFKFLLSLSSCGVLLVHFSIVLVAIEDGEMGPDGKRVRPGISNGVILELTDCNAVLSQQRKKRQVNPGLI